MSCSAPRSFSLWAALVAILSLLLSGCLVRPTEVPMPALDLPAEGATNQCLVVLLPGRWDRPQDFVAQGFPRFVEEAGLAVDMVAVDAHMGYYRDRTVLERLKDDVIVPAQEAGYEKIWLAGLSLGGTGSVLYGERYGNDVAGIFLLAPFLGRGGVIQEIQRAGGAASWEPSQPVAADDFERGMWWWLKDAAKMRDRPVYLGYGLQDKLADGHDLLAEILPESQVLTRPGGHDWQTWSLLWQEFLASGALASCDAEEHNR